ncbi:MAG: S8 family serine peptidase, partial [Candidatus Eisenbacteria bacterium]|nr:S8 family serine peptidase [Candidatus Eisenbacteria bacterium]
CLVGSEMCIRDRIHAFDASVLEDHWTPGYYTIVLPPGLSVFAAVRGLYADPEVLFAEPSYLLWDDALSIPNDPLFPQQWSENNTGQGGGTPGADVEAPLAWDITKGDPNVIIAVIDTGADLNHEDLRDNFLPRNGEDWDFANGPDGSPDDEDAHGTCCSGIAAAVQDNSLGVSGIAPHCRIMPLRVDLGSGMNQNRADAINYAASRRAEFTGLVMSCSWRMSSGDFTAVHDAVINADALDCIMVFASGNSNANDVNYPARYPETIACGASSPCDQRKSYTSCDGENFWGSNYGAELDVISPGVKITTTDRTGVAGYSGTNYTTTFNGTSSATPLTAGICALIWSAAPSLDAHQVRAMLEEGAEDQVGPPNEDSPGWDMYFGWGRVNANRSVVLASDLVASIEEGFEGPSAAEWRHDSLTVGYTDAWHLSQQRNHTDGGQTSYKCGDAGDGPYGTRIHAYLQSPLVRVPDGSRLIFWHWMDAYAVDDSTAGDGGILEASTDSGASWFTLQPIEGGYDHVWRRFTVVPFVTGTPLWSGSFDWTPVVVPLEAYAGQILSFRFRFGTRGQEPTGEGWYIDDVTLFVPGQTAVGEPAIRPFDDLKLFPAGPNPFHATTSIHYEIARPMPVQVDLLDLSGRRVRSLGEGSEQGAGMHEVLWDGRDDAGRRAPSGIYFCRVTAGAVTRTERIVGLP